MLVPIAAVLLSLIFLLLTIHLSRQHGIPAWKASTLAVLLSLGIELRRDLGGIGQVLDMEEEAKSRSVRLEASDHEQWHIVKAD